MYLELNAPKITKMALVLPKNSSTYENEMSHFNADKLKQAKEIAGVNRRYFCDDITFTSDLCIKASEIAINDNKDIDAIITVSMTPDYLMPKLSNIISHRLNLSSRTLCIDSHNFCNGFVSALLHAAMLLEHCNRVALICADVGSKIVDPNDKQFIAITSDSASAVILEKSDEKMYFIEEAYLDDVMKMSTLVSACKNGDKFLKTNNAMLTKKVFECLPGLYKKFISQTPKGDINIMHSTNKFFQNRIEKECKTEFFDKSLEQFGCLYVNDIPMNLILAQNETSFKNKKRALLIGQGTGLTINMANLPIWSFDSEVLLIKDFSDRGGVARNFASCYALVA